jgi:hypothetical protein
MPPARTLSFCRAAFFPEEDRDMKKLLIFALLAGPALGLIAQTQPDHIAVQHVLIAFKGSIPEDKVTRTQAEAEALAQEIFERAKKGEDFDALVKQYTDDEYPGVYRMSNFNATPDPSKKEYPRARMVKAFGDVGFSLAVGEIGLAVYDPATSKYGWHIIKRIE